jgi:soluble lytic murein transglycosylase-like protein
MTRFLLLVAIGYQAIVHGFDPRIIAAQVFVESSFRPHVVNRGCYGLMQVSLATWKSKLQLDKSRMLEVNYNLCKGLCILRIYYRQTGSMDAALARYNAGFKYDGRPYVRKIRRVMDGIKNKGEQNGIY